MKILSIDTSSKKLSIAVSDNEKIMTFRNFQMEKSLSTLIIPSIEQVLKKAGVPLENIEGFAVGLGPGSFTSLRVGLATVKGLSFALNKPVVGVSSLDILANSIKNEKGHICAVCDARRNMVYWAIFERVNGRLKKISPYHLSGINKLCDAIKQNVIFVGDGIDLYQPQIKAELKNRVSLEFSHEKCKFPQARFLVPLAWEKLKTVRKESREPVLVPIYLYPEDCQVKK